MCLLMIFLLAIICCDNTKAQDYLETPVFKFTKYTDEIGHFEIPVTTYAHKKVPDPVYVREMPRTWQGRSQFFPENLENQDILILGDTSNYAGKNGFGPRRKRSATFDATKVMNSAYHHMVIDNNHYRS